MNSTERQKLIAEKAKLIEESLNLSSSRSRRFFAWKMAGPMFAGREPIGPWQNYPDSPAGTLEVWDDEKVRKCSVVSAKKK